MDRQWTFGQRLGAGLAIIVGLAMVVALVGVVALQSVIASKDQVIGVDAPTLLAIERLNSLREHESAAARGYLLVGEERYIEEIKEIRRNFAQELLRVRRDVHGDDILTQLASTEDAKRDYSNAVDRMTEMRRNSMENAAILRAFDNEVVPRRDRLASTIEGVRARQERQMTEARTGSNDAANRAITLLIVVSALVIIVAVFVAFGLARTLSGRIGTAVSQVQSSSTELQAAARQQAVAAKEQATAVSEVSTTMSELIATSRQISDSARKVAEIAEETATAARSGDGTVERAQGAIGTIRRQVDLIVTHMVEMGRTSQRVGSVLDIASELAEQTNILAINATIEAAGAGEAGKRFAVVADEIRKLADRFTESTKEIRGLVDDVRSSVNSTVMVTETGSKAVEAGAKQFNEVTASLRQISSLVTTTTEASREIELSTKQQTSAVEQVNGAIASVAQATKETEAGTGQTMQTATQLAQLSRDLMRLVRAES